MELTLQLMELTLQLMELTLQVCIDRIDFTIYEIGLTELT